MVIERGEIHRAAHIEKALGEDGFCNYLLCLQCNSTPQYIGVNMSYVWKTQYFCNQSILGQYIIVSILVN